MKQLVVSSIKEVIDNIDLKTLAVREGGTE